jgi:hypothetical protein
MQLALLTVCQFPAMVLDATGEAGLSNWHHCHNQLNGK